MEILKIAVLEGDELNGMHDDFFLHLNELGVDFIRKDYDNLYSEPEKLDSLVDFEPTVIVFMSMNVPTEGALKLHEFLCEFNIYSIQRIVNIGDYGIGALEELEEIIQRYVEQGVVFHQDNDDFLDYIKLIKGNNNG